jgi:hypothetical protein
VILVGLLVNLEELFPAPLDLIDSLGLLLLLLKLFGLRSRYNGGGLPLGDLRIGCQLL